MAKYLFEPFTERADSYEKRRKLVLEFFEERCERYPSYRQPIRELGQAWQSWLLVQSAPSEWRTMMSAHWLRELLLADFHLPTVLRDGRRQVVGLRLRDDLPPLPGGTRTETRWSALQDAVPEIAATLPLAGATPTRRPSDEEILRRFFTECCTITQKPPKGQETPRFTKYDYRPRDSFTRVAERFRLWLTAQGASPSLLALCSSRWLRKELVRRGHEFVIVGGRMMVHGIQVRADDENADVRGSEETGQ